MHNAPPAMPTKKQAISKKQLARRKTAQGTRCHEELDISRQSKDDLPLRVLRFLRAVSHSEEIAWALEPRGYGAAEHADGLRLLAASYPYAVGAPSLSQVSDDEQERTERMAQELGVLRAVIKAHHPSVWAIIRKADDKHGARRPIAGLFHVLAKLNALTSGPKLAPQSEEARLLALLERRGYGAARREELFKLLSTNPTIDPRHAARRKERAAIEKGAREARVALHRWLVEWSLVAKLAIRRRDWLVRLGLATRQRSAATAAPAPVG